MNNPSKLASRKVPLPHGPFEQDNEQLEFSGNAVLGLVVAEILFRRFPEFHEGEWTRLRASLVSRRHMAQVADSLELGSYLRLGRGEEKSGGRKKSALLANSVEAIIAALYLDGGLPLVESFVNRHVIAPYLQDFARPWIRASRSATTSPLYRNFCKPREPVRPTTCSKRKAAPIIASVFWWK